MKLSVILCTYNPRRGYLERTLAALRAQTWRGGEWEFILVDNDSAPAVASWLELAGLPGAKIVTETARGFTPALLRGLREATGELCVLVHDDNVLAPDYFAEVGRIATEFPRLGAWGGQFRAEYEKAPAAELEPFLHYLAVNPIPRERWSNKLYDYEAAPAGAGMAVRTHVLREWAARTAADPRRRELGRRDGGITSCEDFDIAFTAIDLGLGMGVFPSLNITHLIPAGRVEREYLVRLVEGHACSTVLLHALRGNVTPPARGLLAAVRRWRYLRALAPAQREIAEALRRGERRGHARLATLAAGPAC
jgi:glycosyltransferase involved in cell wall biosynthesis